MAVEYGNPQIEQQHVLMALLTQEDGLIPQLLQRMDMNTNAILQATDQAVKKLPRVTGGQTYVASDLEKTLVAAEKTADNMKDEYVSVEHIFLAMLNSPNTALKEIFKQCAIQKEAFMKVLATVRGNTRVTSDEPEATYDALKNMAQIWWRRQGAKNLTPLLDVMMKLEMSFGYCPEKRKIILF